MPSWKATDWSETKRGWGVSPRELIQAYILQFQSPQDKEGTERASLEANARKRERTVMESR